MLSVGKPLAKHSLGGQKDEKIILKF